ncbi:MAG: flagellar basal-body rod protein FlgF [Syntrophales bacterium]|jgi:flagellar hook protein FlgE
MGSALYAGISGLNASSTEMDVIANNIANVNTVGYKTQTTFFADVLSQSLSGGTGNMQVGRGVEVSDVKTQFGPGSFETTSNATDCAINGDGFFIVKDPNGASYYTRAGSFSLNTNGDLVDTNGYTVQGYNFFGSNQNSITDIDLSNVQSAPSTTTTLAVGANLNASTTAGGTFATTQTVYDSLGGSHTLSIKYEKTDTTGLWGAQAALDGVNAKSQTYNDLKFDSTGKLTGMYSVTAGTVAGDGTKVIAGAPVFNNLGDLYDQSASIVLTEGTTPGTWTVTNNGGYTNLSVSQSVANTVNIDLYGTGGIDIKVPLTTDAGSGTLTIPKPTISTVSAPANIPITFAALSDGATIGSANTVTWNLTGTGSLPITDYSSTSVINSTTNDGYASGTLQSVSVKSDGTISGSFTNGQVANVAQLVLANFSDPEGLQKKGSNLFGETITSGQPVVNVPGSSGMGTVQANSLEESNVDIATEFINMITAQKAYSANARVITTEDQMLSDLINIKR